MVAIELSVNIKTKHIFKYKKLLDSPNIGIQYKHLSLLSLFTTLDLIGSI